MAEYRVERSRMYAHIYFDLSAQNGALGIAVYGVGRVPGFSGEPSELVQKYQPDINNAAELFTKTFQQGDRFSLTPDEIQLGKLFPYSGVSDRIEQLELWGRAQTMDPGARVVVDIDDPQIWIPSYIEVPAEEKQRVGEQLRKRYLDSILKGPLAEYARLMKLLKEVNQEDPKYIELVSKYKGAHEGVQAAMQRLYVVISRLLSPQEGPKYYPKKASPPTMIISKKYNLAYYPGFRGSPYMTKQPRNPEEGPSKSTYKYKDDAPGQYWHRILVPDADTYMQPFTIEMVQVEILDQIIELLARLFFQTLSKSSSPSDLRIGDFNQAVIPVTNKAIDLLRKIDENDIQEGYKKAGRYIGIWMDLLTGEMFDTLPELLNAKQQLARAAGVHNANNV